MAEKTLRDLFHSTLKDVYYAEKKILVALPKMAKAAQSEELKEAFLKHRDQTEGQIDRLVEVFGILNEKAAGKKCPAIEGILEEGSEIMDDFKGTAALDAGLIGAAQAVEHYEMSRYGTLRRWAEDLNLDDAATLLGETLEEERQTDEDLTALADETINQKAQMAAE